MTLKKLLMAAAVVVVVVIVKEEAEGLPGTFATYEPLEGKWLPPSASVATNRTTFDECTALCIKHNKCNAYAYSRMEGRCVMYAKGRDKAVKIDGFSLYVQTRSEDDGFLLYKSKFYLKLMLERLTPKEAVIACDHYFYGSLVVVEDDEMNNFTQNMLKDPMVSSATIGVTDEKEEGRWVYIMDGQDIKYSNWYWKGMWRLKDRNCAAMKIDGNWFMTDCWQPEYYFCQIPLY